MTTKFSQFINAGEISVTSQVVGLSENGQNARFNFPGTGIKDQYGSYLVRWISPTGAAASNYITFYSSVSGIAPIISSQGGDADVGLMLETQGNGAITLVPGITANTIISSITSLVLPVGNTAQRPSGQDGAIRYNTDTNLLEYWSPSTWNAIAPATSTISAVVGTAPITATTASGVVTVAITNPVAVNYGGTGAASFSSYNLIAANTTGTGALTSLSAGTTGQILVSQGAGAYPQWESVSAVGVTSVTGTAPITTTTVSGAVTVAITNPVAVQYGGTGVASTTAYSLLAGGTTSTSALQSLASVGTTGQVLTSQGAGALPVWSTLATGVSSVTGTTNQITITGTTANPIVGISATYAGQTSITTVGNISAGQWQSTAVGVAYGGTGKNSFNVNSLILSNASTTTGPMVALAYGTSGQVLVSGGAGNAPVWTTLSTGISSVTGTAPITASTTAGAVTVGITTPVTVTYGGTGIASTTAYSLLAGGTTSTGALQSLASVGTSGQILVSQGAAALPVWTTLATGISSVTGTAPITASTVSGAVTVAITNPVTVQYGGTGVASTTAYALLAGGTTSTGNLQSLASLGTSGQVLTSQGSGALPTWTTPAATGITSVTGSAPVAASTTSGAVTVSLSYSNGPTGRLTLTSNTPVTTTDVTAAGTIYFTPYKGNTLSLYNGTVWVTYVFTQMSLSLSGYTSGNCYDIFVYNNSGTLTLTSIAWTNSTTRATSLSLQNGAYVSSSNSGYLYLGTIYMSASGQTQDALSGRYVWNYYNRITRTMSFYSTASNWTYGTTTWRKANNANYQVNFVIGLVEDNITATVQTTVDAPSGAYGSIGMGLNSTSLSSNCTVSFYGSYNISVPITSSYSGYAQLGINYLIWLEFSYGGTTSFFAQQGGSSNAYAQSGIFGVVPC